MSSELNSLAERVREQYFPDLSSLYIKFNIVLEGKCCLLGVARYDGVYTVEAAVPDEIVHQEDTERIITGLIAHELAHIAKGHCHGWKMRVYEFFSDMPRIRKF